MKQPARPTDVAIIGLACRFPSAAGPRDLWRLIGDGAEAAKAFDDVTGFDADFFNVSPREARAMDPRQRLALELAWELFEDAFVLPATLGGEQVGVYLGAMTDDYALLTLSGAPEHLDHQSFAGIARGMIANRVSYAFGLRGPSLTVDSGQSSSLVAVHLACESLRRGESALAVAGGLQLNLADETRSLETAFGAVSPSGHTYAFDARADGYVRSEGAGLVLLKPLRAALDDGNRIRAVIRGSAVGNAGHTAAGQTVPSVPGEADVIRTALARAGLEAGDLHYVEAHGTGTRVGDPVEANALGEVFAGPREEPLRVGSVKTNIGHTGAAAGVAGLLKAVLAIENALIPPSLNYSTPDPALDLPALGLRVNTTPLPWQHDVRRAGVSSFGMGGTNAHVIVEQAPPRSESPGAQRDDVAVPWVLSARSAAALSNQATRLLTHVSADAELRPCDVAWSLVATRSVFEHRAVLVGSTREQVTVGLAELAAGEPGADVIAGRVRPVGKTAFVFPGQGAQWLAMGRRLHERFSLFANAFDEAARLLDARMRLPLKQVMWGSDPDLLHDTEFAQPALFAVEVALAALWRSWGVEPDLVMGHSVGEIAAAYVAGALSLQDASEIVAARGRLMSALPAGGVMVAVAAGEAEVAPLLVDGVSIAAVNGPASVVLSGAAEPVDAVVDRLARDGRRVRRLAVSHAFHSALMEPMLGDFATVVSGVTAAEPRIPLVSNVTGRLAGHGYGSPDYWVEHVRRPVRFADGVGLAESLGAGVFVEIGPAGGLSAAIEQILTDERAFAVVTMPRDRPEIDSALGAAARLFATGVPVDWAGAFADVDAHPVELPTYGFARQRFWLDERGETAPRPATLADGLHALSADDQRRRLVELVCSNAAIVLGHPAGSDIDAEQAFQDLGFDSMTGVELRNRLGSDVGLALSRTLIFDYPTPAALAEHLQQRLLHREAGESEEERIWSMLRKIPLRELRRTGLLDELLLVAGQLPARDAPVGADEIDALSPDALVAMALNSEEPEDVD
ncbi:type I polyketide synthase [Mycobacterium servetii]|uniref:Type I polyketide synthase n=1 Tax=Mycobacterium servetii TaxID=3237418 RepID=A0ABV4C3P8_9MYCO